MHILIFVFIRADDIPFCLTVQGMPNGKELVIVGDTKGKVTSYDPNTKTVLNKAAQLHKPGSCVR